MIFWTHRDHIHEPARPSGRLNHHTRTSTRRKAGDGGAPTPTTAGSYPAPCTAAAVLSPRRRSRRADLYGARNEGRVSLRRLSRPAVSSRRNALRLACHQVPQVRQHQHHETPESVRDGQLSRYRGWTAMLQPIDPTAPAAGYQGGKKLLAKRICALIERVDHAVYAEPFVGMGGVFLRRRARPAVEIVNDLSRDIATFFRVLQRHPDALCAELAFQVTSRVDFDRIKGLDPGRLTDIERAARFIYLQRAAFGGKVRGRTLGTSATGPARFDAIKMMRRLRELHARMAGVLIECLDWSDFLVRYDRPGTLFYLDPPYFGHERDYAETGFSRDDFARMAVLLGTMRGRFILSLNDTPAVRQFFAPFAIVPVPTKYTMGGMDRAKAVGEVLIGNLPEAMMKEACNAL